MDKKRAYIWDLDGTLLDSYEVIISSLGVVIGAHCGPGLLTVFYFGDKRKAMLEAVGIGGLNCTALLNESSAITFAYGFQKLKEFDDEKQNSVCFTYFKSGIRNSEK